MSSATFTLSAFSDEIADDLATQLKWLGRLRVGHIELRAVDKVNVLRLSDDQVAAIRQACAGQGIGIACIGSPIGKSPLKDPLEQELANLERIFQIAEALGTRKVRIFSFYPPDTSTNAHYDQHVDEAIARLARMAELAQRDGFTLCLENEKAIVGDTPERCLALLRGVNSPNLRFAWDAANFVQVGVGRLTERFWPSLGPYVAHVHVKDAHLADGRVCAAGEGDGQVRELLIALRQAGYQGFLSLEPHLAVAGHSGGFSGPEGMIYAVAALRQLMADTGCVEQ